MTRDIRDVKLAAFDVDGVLTDGRLYYSGSGVTQVFDSSDGTGLMQLLDSGVLVALISFRDHPATRRRARDLGISLLCLGSTDKEESLRELCAYTGVDISGCLFMGDDLKDIPALKIAGIPACPSNACAQVRELCRIVTTLPGGRGAVREVADMILAGELE